MFAHRLQCPENIRSARPQVSRDAAPYAQMGASQAHYAGQDVSKPVAGFFRHRLRSGSIMVGIRIHYGPPLDPVTGEVLDRSWRWMADVNGEPFADFDWVWPGCTGQPISEAEYGAYCRRKKWAEQNAPDSAYAQQGKRWDPLSASELLPF